jgi:hypothetical protein
VNARETEDRLDQLDQEPIPAWIEYTLYALLAIGIAGTCYLYTTV